MTAPGNYRSASAAEAAMAAYEAALERWPVPCETRTVATRAGDTFVLSFGRPDAPPVVLLHGAATNSAMWAAESAIYAAAFHVFALDVPGEAGKSTPTRPSWEGTAFADWLADALDSLALPVVSLVGISQGGWAAIKFAAACPGRLDCLALIAPAGVVPDRTSFALRAIPYSVLGAWGARRIREMVFSPLPPPLPVAATGAVPPGFKARIGIVPRFTDAELRALTMPTLLLGGAQDALRDNAAIGERLSSVIPHLQCELLPNAGHAGFPTAARVVEFLSAKPSPTPA